MTPPAIRPPTIQPPQSPARWSPLLLTSLAVLLLLLAGAVVVAAYTFSRRTAGNEPEATATVAVVQVTATPAAATAAPTAPAAPTATVEMLPSPTLASVKTAAPTAAPQPSLTPPAPTAVAEAGIAALSLVNPGDNDYLFELRDGATVDLSEVGTNYLTLVADVSGPVGSVTFFVDGERHCRGATCVENAPPYYMHGDAGGDPYRDWDWSTMLGAHMISAVACTGPDATGRCYPALEIDLTVTP